MRRILPFPTRSIQIAKAWNDDEVKSAYKPPASAVADFKRVCDATGVETREEPCSRI